MAIGSGLGSQFGFSAESTVNTRVAAAKFIRAKSFSLERVATRVQGEGIQTGNFGDLAAHYGETTYAGAGSVEFDVTDRTMGVLLNTLMGGSVTPSLIGGTGSSYGATFNLADTYGKSMTVQGGLPRRDGTVVVHELTGTKVTQATFSCGVGEFLSASFTFDSMGFSDSQTLASASYVGTNVPFNFKQMSLKMGTYSSETSISGVRAVSVTIDRPHDTEDYTAGAAGVKSQPVLNGATQITGTITADWLDKATFQTLAHGTTATSLVWEFVGPTAISGSNYPTFRLTLPSVHFEPATQSVGGREELTNDWSFKWAYDGTNQPSIYTISADTAL